jgi:hypothetical protein
MTKKTKDTRKFSFRADFSRVKQDFLLMTKTGFFVPEKENCAKENRPKAVK